ncbi:MAG: sensor domain-containing protein [Mycolicibacterium sp.]|nr:sensor domain-containing protein [Mycobacterium sp.]MCB9418033.1 sensor domain-containing protein [Mycolicibacterium sp.]
MLCVAAGVLVLTACTATVGGTALPRHSKTLPVEQILPSAAEVAAAVGNPIDPGGPLTRGGVDVLPNGIRDDSAASPIGCLGAVLPFMRVVYEKGDIRAVAWQDFSRFGTGATVSSVDAGVIDFGSNAEAQRMFDAFAAQWRGCQGTTMSTHLPVGDLHATVTDVRTNGPILSATIRNGDTGDADSFPTEHAVGVAGSYIVDVDAAITAGAPAERVATGRAVRLATVMLDKIGD